MPWDKEANTIKISRAQPILSDVWYGRCKNEVTLAIYIYHYCRINVIIILTNLSSDWRSISPKIDRGQAHAQWRSELLAANENHLPSQFIYVFPLLTSPFFSPH